MLSKGLLCKSEYIEEEHSTHRWSSYWIQIFSMEFSIDSYVFEPRLCGRSNPTPNLKLSTNSVPYIDADIHTQSSTILVAFFLAHCTILLHLYLQQQ